MARTCARLLLVAIVVGGSSRALAASAQASVDRPETTVDEPLLLSIAVEGSSPGEPRLPELPDFEVQSRGTSSQVSIINGRMSSSLTYSYALQPRRPGTFVIGPAQVQIAGRSYTTQPLTVRVLPSGSKAREGGEDVFITAEVSTREPYVGQQLVYTLRLFHRVPIEGQPRAQLPDFDGFTAEPLPDTGEHTVMRQGQAYAVSELRRALFAQEAGQHTLAPATLLAEVRAPQGRRRAHRFFDDPFGDPFADFFGRGRVVTRSLRTAAVTVTVRPLPPAPATFTGLVGSFGITTKLSKSQLKVGESATLEITIEGRGNVRALAEPQLPSLPAFKLYDDKPEVNVRAEGDALVGRKTFRKALVPHKAGDFVVPAVALTYFDPSRAAYATAESSPIAVHVLPGENQEPLHLASGGASETPHKQSVEVLADDILPLHTRARLWSRQERHGLWQLAAWALALPPLAFIAAWVTRRRREQALGNPARSRRRVALRQARRCLREAQAQSRAGERSQVWRAAERALKGFVGDVLDMPPQALTASEIEVFLTQAGITPELVRRVATEARELEAATYGGGLGPELDVSNRLAALERLLRELDRVCPEPQRSRRLEHQSEVA